MKSWKPTRKWLAAAVTAVGTIVVMALTGNGIDNDTEITAVVGLIVARVIAYLVPNEPTAGGVPR